MERELVIVAARRCAFGRYLGALGEADPVDLATQVAAAVLREHSPGLSEHVEQVFVGNCLPASFDTASVAGRQISLALGLSCFATTIDTACCSPLTGLRIAGMGIRLGDFDCALVLGIEMMSRVPHVVRGLRPGVRVGPIAMQDPIFPIEYKGYNPVSVDAANGAESYGVSKKEMDLWALRSHQKWAEAEAKGLFRDEIVPVCVPSGRSTLSVVTDESPRPTTTAAKISALPPIFGSKTITAGNAPGLNDGAAAVVLMSREKAESLGITPLCRIIGQDGLTAQPEGISWVPALAIRKVLRRADMVPEDLSLIEINEAFAAMPLVSTRVLAGQEDACWNDLLARTNVNGGAVAIGHPVGASGLRILMTLAYELRRRSGGIGVAAICGGLAQGEAVLIEVEDALSSDASSTD